MAEFSTENIKNITLIGHGDSGKTLLTEGFLFATNETKRMGSVEEGTTVSDYNEDEKERAISINSSLLNCVVNNTKINIIDTPGYIDFTGQAKSALNAVEIGALVVNASSGIEVGTEVVWGYCQKDNIPRIIIVNKLDKENTKYDDVVDSLKESFTAKVIAVQFPVNGGDKFDSIVDVINMKMLKFAADGSGKYTKEDIPSEHTAKADDLRNELKEAVAESDDDLLEKYLEEGDLSDEELNNGILSAIKSCNLFPVLCSSASKNVGALSILDFVASECPGPAAMGTKKAKDYKSGKDIEVTIDKNGKTSLQIFKTVSEEHVGELSYFKCYSGTVKTGMELYNTNRQASERIGQIFSMNGHTRKEVAHIAAGDIGAVVKLKDTHTGDSLSEKDHAVEFPQIEFPSPIIRVAIKPKSKGDEAKVATGLHKLHEEDPSFIVNVDSELRQTILAGQGELHLDIIIKRLEKKYGVSVETEDPKIPYRETIKKSAKAQGKYKKQSGGKGQYGDTWVEISPTNRGEGFVFENNIVGGVIPTKFIPAVEKGIIETLSNGVVAGCTVIDVKVRLYDGSFHAVDSSDMSFKIAGSMAFKNAFSEAKPILLEPVYEVEVIVPEEYMGDIMGDLSSRRGKIQGTQAEGNFQVIKAIVPLAELYKYSTALRSMTSGRGLHRRKFNSYEEMPQDLANKVIQDYQESRQH